MRSFMLSVAAGMMVAGSGPAHAVAQADGPPQVWRLEWVDSHCTISTGSRSNSLLSLWMIPGNPYPDLYIIGPPTRIPFERTAYVRLGKGNGTFTGVFIPKQNKAGDWVVDIIDLGPKFPSALANASEVQISGLQEPIPVKGVGEAMAALRQCIDDKLNAWGIDAKAYDSLRSPPIEMAARKRWSVDEFPEDAKKAGFVGDVMARVDVGARGEVTGCAVVVSSGMTSVDRATCAKIVKDARFKPAIGADGQPVAASRTLSLKFNLKQ